MEEIKEDKKLCINTNFTIDDYSLSRGISKTCNNNYASSYAIPISPISTPKPIERKGHNGMHESHISSKK